MRERGNVLLVKQGGRKVYILRIRNEEKALDSDDNVESMMEMDDMGQVRLVFMKQNNTEFDFNPKANVSFKL